jgi:hypothetical protein
MRSACFRRSDLPARAGSRLRPTSRTVVSAGRAAEPWGGEAQAGRGPDALGQQEIGYRPPDTVIGDEPAT